MIDVLVPQPANMDQFFVNTAVTDVPLTPAGTSAVECVPFIAPYFAPNDSLTILSIGYHLPHAFLQGTSVGGWFKLQVQVGGGGPWTPYPGSIADQWMPMLGGELNNGFFGAGYSISSKYRLRCLWSQQVGPPAIPLPSISMAGVPASLNGTTQYGYFWLKVEHNLTFVA